MRRPLCLLTTALLCITITASVCAAPSYTIMAPLTAPSSDYGTPIIQGINNAGQVLGRCDYRPNHGGRSFVWQGTSRTDLGLVTGTTDTVAMGINNYGQVTGINYRSSFLWQSNEITSLPVCNGWMYDAYDINDLGQVVGRAYDGPEHTTLYIWQDGIGFTPLPSIGGNYNIPWGISNTGYIAGQCQAADGYHDHAVVWKDGELTDLHTPDLIGSAALDVNDSGWVVGVADTETSSDPVLWRGGAMTLLGNLGGSEGAPYDINNRGQVVGAARTAATDLHAFIWQDSVMADLNDLIAPNSGWVLKNAAAINENGWIAGTGTYNGQDCGFVLVPVPEPSSALALLSGLGVLGLAIRRRR